MAFLYSIAIEGQDVGYLGLTDFDGQIIAEDEDVEVVGVGVGFTFGRNGIADVILAVSRFGLGDVQALHAVEEVFKDVAAAFQAAVDEGVVAVGIVAVDDDAAGRGHVGDPVDEDQFAKPLVMTEGVDDDRFLEEQGADGNFVLRHGRGPLFLARIDIDGVVDVGQDADDFFRSQFDDVFFADD